MSNVKYKKAFRMEVVNEALKPEYANMEDIVARKYGVRPDTVLRWKEAYLTHGEKALSENRYRNKKRRTEREIELEKENAALREEVEILKKAAAFLAKVGRE